jgi:outer membrane protein assembly factor BamB
MQHPLIEQVSKEGFNVLAEFQAALDGEAYDDVCQLITTMPSQAVAGLLPDGKDRDLMLSLSRAVALAVQQRPGLKQAMREKLGDVALLRVRQAKLAGDAHSVQATTLQYLGTPAVAEAHEWLGDRALAAGDAEAAAVHYARALADAAIGNRPRLAAMTRLAAAMLGRDTGQPVREAVSFGGTQLSSAEFEQLVVEMRSQRRESGAAPARAANEPSQTAPSPARFTLRGWAEFSAARAPDLNHPYSATIDGDTLYLGGPQQISAFDLANGKARWESVGAGVVHRVLVAGERVYARRATDRGGELVALDARNGTQVWPKGNVTLPGQVVSDPFLYGENLLTLAVAKDADGTLDVRLLTLDPASGNFRKSDSLIRLHDVWNGRVPCEADLVEDQVIAAIGGCVLCCDVSGQALWVRKQLRPPQNLPPWGDGAQSSYREPPLVVGDKVFVLQRECVAVECLDRHTGRLHWRHVRPDVRRILGVAENHLLLETEDALRALDAESGRLAWHREANHLLDARLCGGQGGLLYARRERLHDDTWRPCLVWPDPKTGIDVGRVPLAQLTSKQPVVGPFIATAKGLLVLAGEMGETRRRIWELAPRGDGPAPVQATASRLSYWLPEPTGSEQERSTRLQRLSTLRGDVETTLPAWTLVASDSDQQTGWHDQRQGKNDVAVTLANSGQTVRLLREINIPPGGSCKLNIEVGHVPSGKWDLEITAGGQPLFRSEVSEKTAQNGWLHREIDLAKYAGRTLWLAVTHRSRGQEKSYANWRKLEIK